MSQNNLKSHRRFEISYRCSQEVKNLNDTSHGDEPVTIEGHDVQTGVVQYRVEEVVGPTIARSAKYPTDTGEQMPPLTYGGSDNKPMSQCRLRALICQEISRPLSASRPGVDQPEGRN